MFVYVVPIWLLCLADKGLCRHCSLLDFHSVGAAFTVSHSKLVTGLLAIPPHNPCSHPASVRTLLALHAPCIGCYPCCRCLLWQSLAVITPTSANKGKGTSRTAAGALTISMYQRSCLCSVAALAAAAVTIGSRCAYAAAIAIMAPMRR